MIYGFRISVLFGLTLTILSSVIGVAAGAVQGYFGGLTDLLFQRFIEIWSGLPVLFLLIILASIVEPNFWWLLGLLLLFSWMGLVGVVRAEFLRARNFDYVRAARALGVGDWGHHVQAHPAQRHGGDHDLPALHPEWLHRHPDGAGLPGLRPATGIGVVGRDPEPGQGQFTGPVAGADRVLRVGRHADLLVFVGEAVRRRLRSAQGVPRRDARQGAATEAAAR